MKSADYRTNGRVSLSANIMGRVVALAIGVVVDSYHGSGFCATGAK